MIIPVKSSGIIKEIGERLIISIRRSQFSLLSDSLQRVWHEPGKPCIVFEDASGKEAGYIARQDEKILILVIGLHLYHIPSETLRDVFKGRQTAAPVIDPDVHQSILVA
jgi:hypothetical protein